MASASWPPDTTDQGKLQAFRNLSAGLAERPEVYGVSAGDAAEAVRLAAAAEEAAFVASCPATRTTLTTAAKREAMEAAQRFCRPLVAFLRLNPNLSEADRMIIGVPAKGETRKVIPPATTAPILSLRRIIPGGHEIELFDSAKPDRRGMHPDCRRMELFVAYSPNNGGSDAGLSMDTLMKMAKPHSILTRALSRVIHPNERVGSITNYIGRWINARGEAGPFSQPVRMVLAMPGEGKLSAAA